MSPKQTPVGKLDNLQQCLFSQVGIVGWQIAVAQIAGILLILVPSLIMGGGHHSHIALTWCVAALTAVYYCYVWLWRFWAIVDSEERLDRYRGALGILVVCDTIIILGAIGLSGGIYKSHLGFVLLLIPTTVALSRGWGATLQVISLIILAIVGMETYGLATNQPGLVPSHWGVELFQHLFSSIRYSFVVTDPTDAKVTPPLSYAISYAVGVAVGIMLSSFQAYLGSGKTIPDRIRIETANRMHEALEISPPQLKALDRSVARAFHRMSRVASRTSLPDLHFSVVHPLDDVVLQAYVIASPGLRGRHNRGAFCKRSMRKAAEMVFAVHWLDDAFDYLEFHKQQNKSGDRIDMATANTRTLGKFYSPHGINRMLSAIKGEFRFTCLGWAKPGKPPWKEGVETGLIRTILGGLIQLGNKESKDSAIARFRTEVETLIADEALKQLFIQTNTAFLWGISKTDMPLVLGMFWNGTDHADIRETSFVFDSLFMPLLVWHDLEQEMFREHVPCNGFSGTGDIKTEVTIATATAVTILTHPKSRTYFTGQIWDAILPILDLVYNTYESHMPSDDAHNAYRDVVKSLIPKD